MRDAGLQLKRIGSPEQGDAMGREHVFNVAYLVEQDFRKLVGTLAQTIALVGDSDEELVQQLVSTKTVAERGLRLSKVLSKLARKPKP